jgi:hypothetical protein
VRTVLKSQIVLALTLVVTTPPAHAERIDNKIAVFAALDKVTARISKLEVALGDTVKFGSLRLTPRACYTRSATELPKTTTFVEVDETLLNGDEKRLFTGWMLAESPGLNAVEHPVFDVWLTECRGPAKAPAPAAATKPGPGQPAAAAAGNVQSPLEEPAEPRRRVRR